MKTFPSPSSAPHGDAAQPPDFEGANAYALDRLACELSPCLHYHNLNHTRDDILPAAERLARYEGLRRSTCQLLKTACCYHDLGFIVAPQNHEATGAQIAAQVLPDFGFSPLQISIIQSCILVTRIFTPPRSLIEAIIVDADLDVLGRADFLARGQALLREQMELGHPISEDDWLRQQLAFLKRHQYRTISAQALRGPQKRENIRQLTALLGLS